MIVESNSPVNVTGKAMLFSEGPEGWHFVRREAPTTVEAPHADVAVGLLAALRDLELDFVRGGTYVCTEGPRLETPAEIRKFALCGADLVGMTLVPEVFLAKELEMCYAALCYVTNYAEGIKKAEFQPGMLFEGLADEKDAQVVEETLSSFPKIVEGMAELAAQRCTATGAVLQGRYGLFHGLHDAAGMDEFDRCTV